MYTLIADSGSTKTDWVLIDRHKVLSSLKTMGFNPYFQTREQISDEISKQLKPQLQKVIDQIDHVYYYGAGCSNTINCDIVEHGISDALKIRQICIHHDLLAAARALCGTGPGIACILGTGSNSCLYDGKQAIENIPSVGYMFGDNGSGAHIGKTFIQSYFDGDLPQKLKSAFEKAGYNREEILDNIYKKPMPNRYLASISKFVAENYSDQFIKRMVKNCITSFFDKQINRYTNARNYKVHSVGSIGFYYREVLKEVANEEGYTIENIIQSPIEGLVEYHQSLL
jgi:N-acetylglucosamine kinase-like BadF-type ATPase